jgi:hypothetical protein
MNPHRPVAAAAVRILPPALLLVLVMAGLRGAVGSPRFTGPYHQYGVGIGTGLAVVLTALLTVTGIRHAKARPADGYQDLDTAAKLRAVLMVLLSGGIVADVVAILVGLHLHLFKPSKKVLRLGGGGGGGSRPPGRASPSYGWVSVVGQVFGYVLLTVVVLGIIFAIVRWARMQQPPAKPGLDGEVAADTEEALREAVEQGRRALQDFDDARAAIIACYAAMEETVAKRGVARAVADTPDELLARATRAGIVQRAPARALTRLFYEARFSTHPMNESQRAGAQLCLDELVESQRASRP